MAHGTVGRRSGFQKVRAVRDYRIGAKYRRDVNRFRQFCLSRTGFKGRLPVIFYTALSLSLRRLSQVNTLAPLRRRSKTKKGARRSNDPGSGCKGRSSIEAYDDRTIDREARASKCGSAWSRK
jgi:hypothetical protein